MSTTCSRTPPQRSVCSTVPRRPSLSMPRHQPWRRSKLRKGAKPRFSQTGAGQPVQARGTQTADSRRRAVYLRLCNEVAEKSALVCTVDPTLACGPSGRAPRKRGLTPFLTYTWDRLRLLRPQVQRNRLRPGEMSPSCPKKSCQRMWTRSNAKRQTTKSPIRPMACCGSEPLSLGNTSKPTTSSSCGAALRMDVGSTTPP